jgi:hypothetical protein
MSSACRAATRIVSVRSVTLRGLVLIVALLGLGACGRLHETKMTDPRTGVSAICQSTRFNVFTTVRAEQDLAACVAEMSYYGFHPEDELRAAHEGPPPPKVSPWAGAFD